MCAATPATFHGGGCIADCSGITSEYLLGIFHLAAAMSHPQKINRDRVMRVDSRRLEPLAARGHRLPFSLAGPTVQRAFGT